MKITNHRWSSSNGVWLIKNNPEALEYLEENIDNGIVTSCWKDLAAVMNILGGDMTDSLDGNKIVNPST